MMEKTKDRGEQEGAVLVRLLGKDVRGDKGLLVGLTQINGISWAFANVICKSLKMNPSKRIYEIEKKDLEKIELFMEKPKIPLFLKNRRKDFEGGVDKHLHGEDLKLQREFDIKRVRKIKSYKGIRHAANLPVRGQRTKANFRRNRKKSGATGAKKK